MFSLIHTVALIFLYTSTCDCHQIASEEVPAVLWNIKGNSLQMKPVSALGKDDDVFVSSFKDILQDDASILVYTLNKLSLEDFDAIDPPAVSNSTLQNLQTFLDTQRGPDTQKYMFLSSVSDPLNSIHDVHCGVQEIVVDQTIDENVLKSIFLALERSCVVIIHLSDTGIIGMKDSNPDGIKKIFSPSFERSHKNIVGIFTGKKSSWGTSNAEHHMLRNLLAAPESESNFLNITGCIIMYAEKATLRIKEGNKTVSLPFPVDATGSECGNATAILKLNFKPTAEFSSVVVKFNFTNKLGAWTTQTTVIASGTGGDVDEEMVSKDLEANLGFSFSCGSYLLLNRYRNATHRITLSFERFQVQAFLVKDKFSESFDCVTWFTIPIWMGILVSLLFIAIINCGVYALFSVHTMDRFDDPKGKTISVTAAVD